MAILIVEPSAKFAGQIAHALRAAGHPVVFAVHSASQALTTLTSWDEADGRGAIDLLLMDVAMPDMDGVALCRTLRSTPALCDIPIIMLSESHTTGRLPEAFDAGAFDYILKPCRKVELLARVRASLRFNEELKARKKREAELAAANVELKRLAIEDGLTGLANRRHFNAVLEHELKRAVRNGTPLAVGIGDVDHFKGYNDTYGHPAGDLCLQRIAGALRETLKRPADLAARYGGEEFSFILPETTREGALMVAEKICQSVRGLGIEHGASKVSGVATISVGVMALMTPGPSDTPDNMLKAADGALYEAKRMGRNRAVLAPNVASPNTLAA